MATATAPRRSFRKTAKPERLDPELKGRRARRARRPPPPRWRERILPKTVIGITMLILATAVGAAFSGATLYTYYEYRLTQNEQRVRDFITGFDERYANAMAQIEAQRGVAQIEINTALEPLRRVTAEGTTLEALVQKVHPSIFFVNTQDEAGQPSVGSGFVIATEGQQALMLTSFNTVRAATRQPGPAITVRKGDQVVRATLWTWHEEKDLALIILNQADIPKLELVPPQPPVRQGTRIFSVSGLGASGGAISQGFVADVSGAGVQHDASVGVTFQGGPLVNDEGQVIAMASRAYSPLGFAPEAVFFGVPIRDACERVLKCPEGGLPTAGDKR